MKGITLEIQNLLLGRHVDYRALIQDSAAHTAETEASWQPAVLGSWETEANVICAFMVPACIILQGSRDLLCYVLESAFLLCPLALKPVVAPSSFQSCPT